MTGAELLADRLLTLCDEAGAGTQDCAEVDALCERVGFALTVALYSEEGD